MPQHLAERLCRCVQGVKHFKDIRYTPTLTYGEMLLQNEYEMSCYNLDSAHVPSQQQLFQLHQQVGLITASPIPPDLSLRLIDYVGSLAAATIESTSQREEHTS
jgi:glycyl-tRNA synthetase alpha subunit